MATRAEIELATAEYESTDVVFSRLLLAHGPPPKAHRSLVQMAEWDTEVIASIKRMLPKADHEMVLWHFQMWLQQEGKT